MSLTQHIGYGRFHLEDFLPGELFARFDGNLCMVCDPQPHPPPVDRIEVWLDFRTANARKEFLHRTALAHAVTEEQAWAILRRDEEANGEQ